MSTTSDLPDSTKNISKLYIDKLKREEEEDQWISGEELNTDESSDEDVGAKPHRGGARPKAKSKRPSDVPPLGTPPTDEPSVDISWKPKQGSIRLPRVIADNTSQPPHLQIDTSKPTCRNNVGD